MNSAAHCHQVEGCPGVVVDDFRHNKNVAVQMVILTHYHGDHYAGLPKDFQYQGPAQIHCTPITAALLCSVHGVSKEWVIPHEYGETWKGKLSLPSSSSSSSSSCLGGQQDTTTITTDRTTTTKRQQHDGVLFTFYDANHCPGAALVLIELPDGRAHLHTGDVRYCSHKMNKKYPRLHHVVQQRQLDLVYLDTTYCHPRHNFGPQQEAIGKIAQDCARALLPSSPHDNKDDDRSSRASASSSTTTTTTTHSSHSHPRKPPNTLILLSCYNIGKEKILWEASRRCGQPVYVTQRKYEMLQCVMNDENDCDLKEYITRDPSKSNLHVVPMGLAGELWPYFVPNYKAVLDYAQGLCEPYDKVVAFVPTGWAHASNWNKKHAVSRKDFPMTTASTADSIQQSSTSHHTMEVEIRLVMSYSEHSSFSELCAFVEYLKPRRVIPTVFSDDKERRKMEGYFSNFVDSTRAKRQFFQSMTTTTTTVGPPFRETGKSSAEPIRLLEEQDPEDASKNGTTTASITKDAAGKRKRAESVDDANVATLLSMGFDARVARRSLELCDNCLEAALDSLLRRPTMFTSVSPKEASSSKKAQQRPILQFFSPKKKS